MDLNFNVSLVLGLAASLSACGGGGSSDGSGSGQGRDLVAIPDVVNLSEREATVALEQFTVELVASKNAPTVAVGRVISQMPVPCSNCANQGDTITLEVSALHDYQVQLPAHFLIPPFPVPADPAVPVFQPAVIDTDNTGSNLTTNEGATLGRVLFYDVSLSFDRTVSCASCHIQAHGFSDPEVLSNGINGGQTRRHSMGLANARFFLSGKAFWDQRAATMEEQALIPIQDPNEMGLALPELEERLANLDYYPDLFAAAFGDPLITSERVGEALAQFVRSMVSIGSKYDRARIRQYDQGIESIFAPFADFTPEENRGKEIFLRSARDGGGSCFSCHSTEAFINSVAGPTNNGLDEDTSSDEGACEPLGLELTNSLLCGKFKVPSLKNIAVRPPYMHDGRFATLADVIEHYDSGIQPHRNLGEALIDPSGAPVRLNLSPEDKAALLAFLETLTDEIFLSDEKFSDPFR